MMNSASHSSNHDLIIESIGDDENKNEYFEGG